MNTMSYRKWFTLVAMVVFGTLTTFAWGAVIPTNFTNIGSIKNTRHNMSMSGLAGISAVIMNEARNQYEEVCVYCHTPHGSQTLLQMPLWNRTIKATTYTTYNSFSLTQGTAPQPGNNSLTCLSCHDGQTAIDSIINMPGSGRGDAGQATTQNAAFLDTWNNSSGMDTVVHRGINSVTTSQPYELIPPIPAIGFPGVTLPAGEYVGNGTGSDTLGCMTCHSPEGANVAEGNDMRLFNIGTDLTNDHPVGINYPAASGVGSGFNLPAAAKGTARYFDNNLNGHMDTDEVRLYGTSGTVRVECASCHDPHGVPDPANGNVFKLTFLRVANNGAAGSALCLTCHDK